MGVASSRPVVGMAAIPMVMAEAGSEVTLAVPPPPIAEEERRETGLPVSLDGGALGSPTRSELEGTGGAMVGKEVEQLLVSHGVPVVDIPFNGEEDTGMVQPVVPPS